MDLGLKQKTVFITGASSGIGKATALTFAKETGANIALTYKKGETAARELVREIENQGCKAVAVKMDLADHQNIQQAVEEVISMFGTVHVLVNNAVHWGSGEHREKSFEHLPLRQWEEIVGINLYGTVKITQSVAPYMRGQQFGRIVNVSSDVALDSMEGSGPYGALKSALFGFTANLVTELSVDNILSNVVIPSWTQTERAKKFFPVDFQKEAIKAFPTKHLTQPEDVASLIAYLGSAANGHVNGELVKATGKASQAMLTAVFQEYWKK